MPKTRKIPFQRLHVQHPKKVVRAFVDCDGYCIELAAGWRRHQEEVHFVREDTEKEARDAFARVVRCDCQECKDLIAQGRLE
ncbi:hypothetical protein [Microvirga tunisiensis]|uniref:Uncharacterized protein n=1 Tax=Microvirga tunisiensis TaxID=2108360 RepID=A0A5N7MLJ0_9HYPH|nr:hypothetical protein [Microvirga tunisiensis]MPR09291.1 hypothetical protein [Microvirga tunisiensis]MPR27500.1 hypothetical protein [Microvirga tunisiensis]